MGGICFTDAVIVPMSLFVAVGYHVFLWHTFKHNPSRTSIGIDALKRRSHSMKEGDDKKGMLAVQSLRNTKMVAIFAASMGVLVNVALAALGNNAYQGRKLMLRSEVFGLESPKMFVVKYGTASLFLMASFVSSSLGVGCLVDAIFLVNACGEAGDQEWCNKKKTGGGWDREYTRGMVERGFVLGLVGNRLMCISVPLLLWIFGPVAVILSTIGLVWVMYHLDFASSPAWSVDGKELK